MLTEQLNEQLTNKAQELKAAFSAEASGATIPANYYVLETNAWVPDSPGTTAIFVPQAGTLWIAYLYSNALAKSIFVWHQGGTTTPIELGLNNNIPVGPWDAIVYQLADPSNDMIKLGYAYE